MVDTDNDSSAEPEYNSIKMDCPKCGVTNPPTAQNCDCGYEFKAQAKPMDASKSILQVFLRAVAWLAFAVAALSFGMGGRFIHEYSQTDRVLAEMEGIGVAVVFAGAGAVAKAAAGRIGEDNKTRGSP